MGRKLSKRELKRITDIAKIERKKSGVKKVVKTTVYNKKWTDCIKVAAKKVIAERKIKQTRIRFK